MPSWKRSSASLAQTNLFQVGVSSTLAVPAIREAVGQWRAAGLQPTEFADLLVFSAPATLL